MRRAILTPGQGLVLLLLAFCTGSSLFQYSTGSLLAVAAGTHLAVVTNILGTLEVFEQNYAALATCAAMITGRLLPTKCSGSHCGVLAQIASAIRLTGLGYCRHCPSQKCESLSRLGQTSTVKDCAQVNGEIVSIQRVCTPAGEQQLKKLIQDHVDLTGSKKAEAILSDWSTSLQKFWQLVPPSGMLQ